jgi:hypothetical protein
MRLDIIEHIGDVRPEQFDALDDTAGAAGCHARLRQREADGRWHASYLRWGDGAELRATVPVYSPRGGRWPDSAYDPSTWNLPEEIRQEFASGAGMLVGGCSDRRSGLHMERQPSPAPAWGHRARSCRTRLRNSVSVCVPGG